MLKKGLEKYGKYFQFASENSKLPVEMIVAFSAVESGVGSNIGSAGHITRGIMQWNRDYAKKQLENELALGRMTPAEKDKLKEYGITFDKNGNFIFEYEEKNTFYSCIFIYDCVFKLLIQSKNN